MTVLSQDCDWDRKDPRWRCRNHSTTSQTCSAAPTVEYRQHVHRREILLCKTAAYPATGRQLSACFCPALATALADTHTHTHTQTCTHAHNYGQWLNCLSRGGGSLDFRPVLKGNTMISIHERQTTYRHVIGMHFCKIHIKGHKIMLQRDVLAIKQQDRNKIYCNQHRCQSILTTTSRSCHRVQHA